MTSEFNFDSIELIRVPVMISGRKYTLEEASGDAVCKWRDAMIANTEFNSDGKPTRVTALAFLDMLLLSLCLKDDETGEHVPLETVKSWPHRVINPMAAKVKEISELNEAVVKENPTPGSELNATTGGSD
jgi:hypothetical protein